MVYVRQDIFFSKVKDFFFQIRVFSCFFLQIVTLFNPGDITLPDQTVRFSASVHLVSNGFALFFGHVRVNTLPRMGVRVLPNPTPENRTINLSLVDVRLSPTVRARESKHDFHS
jgi:hypothetical protein